MDELKTKYIIAQMASHRWFIKFVESNSIGEKITIEFCSLDGWLRINVFATDTEGLCWGKYNPQEKMSKDRGRRVINPKWLLEDTQANRDRLINEVHRRAFSVYGKTATEIKIERITMFANKHNIEVFDVLPKGWKILYGVLTAPIGSVWISNMKPIKSGERKHALLIEKRCH